MRPGNETELAEAIRAAAGPVVVRGGGTRAIGLAPGVVLETGGLAGVELYEPGALTLVVRAGTPVAEVEAVLAGERQRLAFEVPDLRGLLGREGGSTIGGVVAANASGPRRVQVGAARDSLLGVRFIDGAGVIVKNGGRVMKNVTGYDLVKLMAGSQGTLGVLSEVSFKVQAVPEAEATLCCKGLDAAAAVAALAAAMGSPFDVSGAAWTPGGGALIRVEGLAGSVAYRAGALAERLGPGWERIEGAALWRGIRDVSAFAGVAGAVWRLSVKPSDAPGVLAALGPVTRDVVMDWAGGLVWLLVDEATPAATIRGALPGGHATRVRGSGDGPAFPPEEPALARLSTGLRAQFDPRGILNQGMMG
ncbi:FAD-binding protein [Tabrizicola sp.]|uniref:FAD-binding protein n=1 Tax=Tabrizicola sp. TaxID=2005166 RepID=UPI00286C8A71|nr:FAD-binding protein [Tabrizicola sp.]